jgi:hypothetical protein
MLAWFGTGLVSLLTITAALWGCYEFQRRYEATRIVKSIAGKDEMELWWLLTERTDFRSVTEWFGEPALIIVVKSSGAGTEDAGFAPEAIRLLTSRGADINEPGTAWKTALMHAAAMGNQELCALLLSYGADASARDMFGMTAADWAQQNGHERTASLLRQVEA